MSSGKSPDERKPVFHGEFVTLLEYVNQLRSADLDQIKTARESMEHRLDEMNQFRSQLKDQAADFITREEFQARQDTLDTRIRALEKLVWMGLGAIIVIQILLRFVHF